MIAVVARQQLESLRRQRVLLATVVSLLAMTGLAGVIGWSSHNTIVRVYNDATALLAAVEHVDLHPAHRGAPGRGDRPPRDGR